ncbi:MAG: hypothetical protein CMJ40_08875 [Phycisphaerae bacterium]|nr:hypothetical protein [Phycisphaerae bacterium]
MFKISATTCLLMSAYSTFVLNAAEPTVWPDQTFVAPDAEFQYTHIDMNGSILAVSTAIPSVRVFTLNEDGTWGLETTIDLDDSDEIVDISIAANRLVIAQEDSGLTVHRRNTSGSWSEESMDNLSSSNKTFLSVDNIEVDSGDDLIVCINDDGVRGFQTMNYEWNGFAFRWELSDTFMLSSGSPSTWGQNVEMGSGRAVVSAEGSTAPPTFDGSCFIYSEVIPGNWSYQAAIDPPTGVTEAEFGSSISLDGDRLAVGAPGVNLGFVTDSTVSIFEPGMFGIWTAQDVIIGEHDGFGSSVELVGNAVVSGSPGLSLESGYIEIHQYDGIEDEWSHVASLRMQSQGSEDGNLGVNVAVSGGNIATFDTGGIDLSPVGSRDDESPFIEAPQTLGMYRLNPAESRFWRQPTGGSISADGNWSGPMQDNAVFSLDGDNPEVLMDGTTSFDQLLIREEVTFRLSGTTSEFGDFGQPSLPALKINGNNMVDTALTSMLGPGSLIFRNDVKIGFNDRKGVLRLDGSVEIDVVGSLILEPVGSLDMKIPSSSLEVNDALISGGLSVGLLTGEIPVEGDSYSLLTSNSVPAPERDAFNLISLPGLPGGLGFEVEYGATTLNANGTWGVQLNVVTLDELIEFGDPASASVDSGAVDIVVTDLTGDGIDEICVLIDGTPGQLSIFNMNSSGNVVEQVVVNAGNSPIAMASGDLDGDTLGTNDLAIVCGDGTVRVLTNNDNDPSDSFILDVFDVNGPMGSVPTSIAAAQLDTFGTALELVVGLDNGDDTGMIAMFASNPLRGSGFGGAGNQNTSSPVTTIDPSEEEKDQDIPFAAGKQDGKTVVASKVSSLSRTFGIQFDEYNAGNGLRDQIIRDFDGDGDVDIMISCSTDNALVLLEQTSPGVFNSPVSMNSGDSPGRMTSGDFNGDGDEDIAVVTVDQTGSPLVQVFDNSGSFVFTTSDVADGEAPELVGSGDIDGDGQDDLVTIGSSSLLNGVGSSLDVRALCPCYGDSNCDGSVDIEDLLDVLGDYGCSGVCHADINTDGLVDIEDLLVIISQWNACSDD